jgi:hypothetical protein
LSNTEWIEINRDALTGDLETRVQSLLGDAFPEGSSTNGDFYAFHGVPDRILIAREARQVVRHLALYQRQVQMGEAAFPLAYRFEPGHPLDGVTMNVPLALLREPAGTVVSFSILFALNLECTCRRLQADAERDHSSTSTVMGLVYQAACCGYKRPWLNRTQWLAVSGPSFGVRNSPDAGASQVHRRRMTLAVAASLPPHVPLGRPLWIFSAATTISLTGGFIQEIAVGWSVWEVTHSTIWLAAAMLADLLPTLIVSAPAGALIDRFRPATIFWLSQVASCLQPVLCLGRLGRAHGRRTFGVRRFSRDMQRLHPARPSCLHGRAYPARGF